MIFSKVVGFILLVLKVVGLILLVYWSIFGAIIGIHLLDKTVVPDPNKHKLAILLTGPISLIIHISFFVYVILKPIMTKIIDWLNRDE
jgi:hypothetical protein